jgi:hypothetical protein
MPLRLFPLLFRSFFSHLISSHLHFTESQNTKYKIHEIHLITTQDSSHPNTRFTNFISSQHKIHSTRFAAHKLITTQERTHVITWTRRNKNRGRCAWVPAGATPPAALGRPCAACYTAARLALLAPLPALHSPVHRPPGAPGRPLH